MTDPLRACLVRWDRPVARALIGIVALMTPLSPKEVDAFEPISSATISLLSTGVDYLFGSIASGPNLHLQKTQQIHDELRVVHLDILENRRLTIVTANETYEQIERLGDLAVELSERIQTDVERQFENARIIDVLAHAKSVSQTALLLPNVGDREREHTLVALRAKLADLETAVLALDHSAQLRAATVLPRILAIQMTWLVYREIEDMEGASEAFIRREGAWLSAQRHTSGQMDSSLSTLGDIIARLEANAVATDRYLSNLSNPCSPLWAGYLTFNDFEVLDNDDVVVREVGVHVATVVPEALDRAGPRQGETRADFADNPMVVPTTLRWDPIVARLTEPVVLESELPSGPALERALEQLHAMAFDCPLSSVRRSGRARLARDVPTAVGDNNAAAIPEIEYDAITFFDYYGSHDEFIRSERKRILERGPCHEENQCNGHWDYVHMRRQIVNSMLVMLYSVRAEVNRTLEWLAEETTGAACRFVRDEPRVCLFDAPSAVTETPSPAGTDSATELSNRSYRIARDWDDLLDLQKIAEIQRSRDQASAARSRTIDHLGGELSRRTAFLSDMRAKNDRHMEQLAEHAARTAWVSLVFSVFQDQLKRVINRKVTEYFDELSKRRAPDDAASDEEPSVALLQLPPVSGEQPGAADALDRSDTATGPPVLAIMNLDVAQDGMGGVTSEIAESFYGDGAGLGTGQKVALWLPEIPSGVTDFSAGLGDSISLGLTRMVRKWTSLSAEVDVESGQYRNGTLVGELAISGAALGNVLGVTRNVVRGWRAGAKVHELGRIGNVSLMLRIGQGQRTQGISLINHGAGSGGGRLLAFDVVTNLRGTGSLASRLPHVHIGSFKAHLPWEPAWLIPATSAVVTTQEAH